MTVATHMMEVQCVCGDGKERGETQLLRLSFVLYSICRFSLYNHPLAVIASHTVLACELWVSCHHCTVAVGGRGYLVLFARLTRPMAAFGVVVR